MQQLGEPIEYVQRQPGPPPEWPVCSWDGASGTDIARSLDGTRWYAADYTGWNGPRSWHTIKTPDTQPTLRGM